MRLASFSRLPLAGGVVLLALVLYACASKLPPAVDIAPPTVAHQSFHYQADIQPIFDDKCVACHACYDAPCQLKLSGADGVLRGATKAPVYDGARLDPLPPTRLGIDATTVEGWREKGFYSALYAPRTTAEADPDDKVPVMKASLLGQMIALGRGHPFPANSRLPDEIPLGFSRTDECPAPQEFHKYAEKHPLMGMPYGATGLSDEEYGKVTTWLAEGAVVEPSPLQPTEAELAQIASWERYLNRDGAREKLVARYLYEHLFIAHLYFPDAPAAKDQPPHFFELLRSRTATGAIVPVATRSPNDNPAEPEQPDAPFSYRLRLITDTVVEKNHVLYALDDARRQRYDALFFASAWDAGVAPRYTREARSNPFLTFAAIPARARYRFLLDDAEYFVRSFIRGPVCAGAMATNVIEDRFWTLFVDPDSDRYVTDAAYRQQVSPLLGLPGEDSKLLTAGPDWEHFRDDRNRYGQLKQQYYARVMPRGPALSDIWDGDGHNHDALLTIFRHHDNASVKRGLIGEVPPTIWVMDYALLERSYYQLVANFDVFGNVSHQLKTRLYFDLIRNGSEETFLSFLPPKSRKPLLDDWYQDLGRLSLKWTYTAPDTRSPTRVRYVSRDPQAQKAEFAQQVLKRLAAVAGDDDVLNRCTGARCALPGESAAALAADAALRPLADRPASELPVIALLPEVVLLRVQAAGGERMVYSLVHDRAHSNVAFIAGEDRRLQPERDRLTLVRGVLGSYPSFIFDVPADELPAFVAALSAVREDKQLPEVVAHWGVRRTHPDFWAIFHDFTRYQAETEPLEAGILDLNRYENL